MLIRLVTIKEGLTKRHGFFKYDNKLGILHSRTHKFIQNKEG